MEPFSIGGVIVLVLVIITALASLRMCNEWERKVVLRLGRNGAEFRIEDATTETLVAAITGADDNVVTQRASRPRPEEGTR